MTYEKQLPEFRQVKHPITECVRHDLGSTERIIGYSYTTQQRWKIEDTTRAQYSPPLNGPPDERCDHFIGVIEGRPLWQPMRFVWRDLPTVSAEEAKLDSQ